MFSRDSAFVIGLVMGALVVSISTNTAMAQEFKIETAIYSGESKIPVAQNITLFQGDLVVDLKVDFATPPNVLETKVYDSRQKKVVLMDHERKVRLEISDNRLLQMVDGLRRDVSQKPELKFLVDESFKETQELSVSTIRLTSPTIRYRVEGGRPQDTRCLKVHGEFLDVFARLNASHPGGFPPFARLKLNESIKKMGWIPSTVEIEMEPNALVTKGLKMKSTHVMINGLSQDDLSKISTAKSQWLSYGAVNLLQFRGIDRSASAKNAVAK